MSYSFSIRAASVAALQAAAAAQLDAVIQTQPVHARDKDLALANLKAHAELVGEPLEGQELVASMHGSISVGSMSEGDDTPPPVFNVGSGCSVHRRQAAAQA